MFSGAFTTCHNFKFQILNKYRVSKFDEKINKIKMWFKYVHIKKKGNIRVKEKVPLHNTLKNVLFDVGNMW
jgi:hypothetical protein